MAWVKAAAYSKLKDMEDTLFNRTFRDSQGEIVLAQMPNLPILVWLAATLLNLIPTTGNIHTGIDAIAFGSLFTWAWLELFEGINYFRRGLGFIVLLGAIAFRLSWSWQAYFKALSAWLRLAMHYDAQEATQSSDTSTELLMPLILAAVQCPGK